ncbi:MAG: anti-sigma factor domain-containing protein [Candidatus Binataceae bacterium]
MTDEARQSKEADRQAGRSRFWARARFWQAVAGMAFAFALGSAIVAVEFSSELALRTQRYRKRTDTRTETIRQLSRDLERAESRANELRSKTLARADLARLLFAQDLRRMQLVATDGASHAVGMIALSDLSGSAMMQMTGLPPTPQGKMYVLWWQLRADKFVKGPEFTAGTDGNVSASSAIPAEAKTVRRCIVTLESESAVSKPSGSAELKCAAAP